MSFVKQSTTHQKLSKLRGASSDGRQLARTVLNRQPPINQSQVNSVLRIEGLMGGTLARFLLDSVSVVRLMPLQRDGTTASPGLDPERLLERSGWSPLALGGSGPCVNTSIVG